MTNEIETWLLDSCVGNNRSGRPLRSLIVSTDVTSDHIGRRDASRRGGFSNTSAYASQFGWALVIGSILSVDALLRI